MNFYKNKFRYLDDVLSTQTKLRLVVDKISTNAPGRANDEDTGVSVTEIAAMVVRRQPGAATVTQVLNDCLYLATRTVENKPLLTGLAIGREEEILSFPLWWWLIKFSSDRQPDYVATNRSGLEKLAGLANGKDSFLAIATSGKILGVLFIEDKDDFQANFEGCLVSTNRFSQTIVLGTEFVCHHDGYAWQNGMPNIDCFDLSPIVWIRENGAFDPARSEVIESRWDAVENVFSKLSERRLSSIVAICDRKDFEALQHKGILRSLFPEARGMWCGSVEGREESIVNVFRLDGVHFLSRRVEMMEICQHVVIPNDMKSVDAGAGTSTARALSRVLGNAGFVVKVSSDGPVKYFLNGEFIDRYPIERSVDEQHADWRRNLRLPLDDKK